MTALREKKDWSGRKSWPCLVNSVEFSQKKVLCPANGNLYAYGANNPVHYIDPDGNDIKEVTLYNISGGFILAGRCSLGVAIDSNCDMAVFIKYEAGIGCGVTAVDESIINSLCLTKLNDISELYDSVSNLKESAGLFNIEKLIPTDTGKGNLNDLQIEDYFIGKIPVSCRRENIKDWEHCPVEACVGIGVDCDKEGNLSFTIGLKAIAAAYLIDGTVYFRINDAVNENQ